jgi:hypothetical protein
MFKFTSSGTFKEGSWNLEIVGSNSKITKIVLVDTDTSKFRYEQGYQKRIERNVKNNKFKYKNITFDISDVFKGVQ